MRLFLAETNSSPPNETVAAQMSFHQSLSRMAYCTSTVSGLKCRTLLSEGARENMAVLAGKIAHCQPLNEGPTGHVKLLNVSP